MKVTDGGVQVDALIRVVKDSVKRAQVSRTFQERDLKVTSVQLILDVLAHEAAGGGVNFRVPVIGMKLAAGMKVTKDMTHTIDITLVPPDERETHEVRGADIEDVLVDAIAAIRTAVRSAAAGDDPWILSAGTISIALAVTQSGTVSLGIDGELAGELTHTLRLGLATNSS
jgi:Trypsin-co-occurring domain 2